MEYLNRNAEAAESFVQSNTIGSARQLQEEVYWTKVAEYCFRRGWWQEAQSAAAISQAHALLAPE